MFLQRSSCGGAPSLRHVPDIGILFGGGFMMAKNTSFVIGDHFASFVEAQVAAGRYGSASDVVRAALRLLEEEETKLAALRAGLIEGETSGASTPFDFEAFIARKRMGDTPHP
jgi:antitoxin ParD1/3/4